MNGRAAVVRAVATKQFAVICPFCESRIVIDTLMVRRRGWRRFFPFGPRPIFACVACQATLDPGLPRSRRITALKLGAPIPMAAVRDGVVAPQQEPSTSSESGKTQEGASPPPIPWEAESDIIVFRRKRRGSEPLNREQRRFRQMVIRDLQSTDLEVPVMPQVAAELSRLFRSSKVNIAKVVEVIQTDLMITATILKLANSALYRGERSCDSLKEAIERLGFAQVEGVVYSLTLSCKVLTSFGYGYDARKLHRHALGVAMFSKLISKRLAIDGGQAFMAGILHDVGKIVILDACRSITREHRFEGVDRVVHELMDLHHARLGGVLCRRWELPSFLQEALRFHHDSPIEIGIDPMAAVLNLSDAMAHVLGLGVPKVRVKVIEHPVLPRLELSPADVETILAEFEEMADDYESLARMV